MSLLWSPIASIVGSIISSVINNSSGSSGSLEGSGSSGNSSSSSLSSSSYPDDGKGYAYTDKYGFSHVVGDLATAQQYGQPGSIKPYEGSYGGGYALDEHGNRIMVNTPGAIPYGNDVKIEQQEKYYDENVKNENIYSGGNTGLNLSPSPYNRYNSGGYNDSFEKRDKSRAKIGVADDGKLNAVSRYLAKDIWANK